MKQRHVQNFLLVSAAFFAMSAPMRGNTASAPQVSAPPAQRVAQVRLQAGSQAGSQAEEGRAEKRASRSDDESAA